MNIHKSLPVSSSDLILDHYRSACICLDRYINLFNGLTHDNYSHIASIKTFRTRCKRLAYEYSNKKEVNAGIVLYKTESGNIGTIKPDKPFGQKKIEAVTHTIDSLLNYSGDIFPFMSKSILNTLVKEFEPKPTYVAASYNEEGNLGDLIDTLLIYRQQGFNTYSIDVDMGGYLDGIYVGKMDEFSEENNIKRSKHNISQVEIRNMIAQVDEFNSITSEARARRVLYELYK